VLSSEANLKIVLQTSGFMPEAYEKDSNAESSEIQQNGSNSGWFSPFGRSTRPPSESNATLRRHIRRVRHLLA
jgi:hypothetical protein